MWSSLSCRQLARAILKRGYASSTAPVELAQIRHGVQRGQYALLEDKDVTYFESIVGKNNVLQENLDQYNIDYFRSVRGNSKLVLKPENTNDVARILKYCNEKKLAVCPQGGNTGLVGGSVPICDEIVLSLQRLDKIEKIDEFAGVVICQSGCILENLDNKMREVGLVVPLDLSAKSSCTIGGNISTNAGGPRVIRYGNLHGSVLGVEAVLTNGTVLDLMTDLRKDNTGYHLKHLFIGSEGTLGVVTKVAIHCAQMPQSVHVAFLGVSSYENVLKVLRTAKQQLGEVLSAFEVLESSLLEACIKKYKLNSPIEGYPYYILIETAGSKAEHDMEKFNAFLEHGIESEIIENGTITGDPGKVLEIWKLRDLAPHALMQEGYSFHYDISIPLKDFYHVVDVVKERVGSLATSVSGYGHLGDSNLHLLVTCSEYSEELYKRLEPFLFEFVSSLKGSISAEHGIGFLKSNYLHYSKGDESIALMRNIKSMLDPNHILNPYKVLGHMSTLQE